MQGGTQWSKAAVIEDLEPGTQGEGQRGPRRSRLRREMPPKASEA